jgi:hypothetical protein
MEYQEALQRGNKEPNLHMMAPGGSDFTAYFDYFSKFTPPEGSMVSLLLVLSSCSSSVGLIDKKKSYSSPVRRLGLIGVSYFSAMCCGSTLWSPSLTPSSPPIAALFLSFHVYPRPSLWVRVPGEGGGMMLPRMAVSGCQRHGNLVFILLSILCLAWCPSVAPTVCFIKIGPLCPSSSSYEGVDPM